jgi:hypothetical protein
MNRSSLPEISPLIRIPWLIHAAALGETGSGAAAAKALTGALFVLGGATPALAGTALVAVACGFGSSFLHITHLGLNFWIFKVVGLEGRRDSETSR